MPVRIAAGLPDVLTLSGSLPRELDDDADNSALWRQWAEARQQPSRHALSTTALMQSARHSQSLTASPRVRVTSRRVDPLSPLARSLPPMPRPEMTPRTLRLDSQDVDVLHSRRELLKSRADTSRWQMAAEEARRSTEAEITSLREELTTLKSTLKREADARAQDHAALKLQRWCHAKKLKHTENDMRCQLMLVQKGQLKRGATQKAAAKFMLGTSHKHAAREANLTRETSRKALSVVERLANDAVNMAQREKSLEMEVMQLRAECRAAANAAATFQAQATDLERLRDYEPVVRGLAAKHFRGIVKPKHIEAAINRDFGIDMNGVLDKLQEPITKSCAVYQAAHEHMRQNAHGYEALLALPQRFVKDLQQQACSDDPARCEEDLNTLYRWAEPANELLLSDPAAHK